MTVWDCFLFNNELQLLAFRLDYLSDFVDRVVLVEAPVTFRGKPKPLYFEQNSALFEQHLGRIVHVVPEGLHEEMVTPWMRERRQHAAIREPLLDAGLAADDLFLVGDMDEIPSADAVRMLVVDPPPRPVRLTLRHALYFANWELPSPWEDGTMAALGRDLEHPDLAVLLGGPDAVWGTTREPKTPPYGWHLSYLEGPQSIALKHEQLSDVSWDNARDKDGAHLERCIRLGVEPAGRHVLHRLGQDELDPLQQQLHEFAPHEFNFGPTPKEAAAYRAYTRMRRRVPVPAASLADRVIPPLLRVLGPAILAGERARDHGVARRRGHRNSAVDAYQDAAHVVEP